MIKGLHVIAKRKLGQPVRWYVYAWRGGPCIMTKIGGPRPTLGRAELDAHRKALEDTAAVKKDTLAGMIRDYQRAPEWKGLADSTRRNWQIKLAAIETRWGDTPLAFWSEPRMLAKVMKWRNEAAAQPRKADIQITVLRHLLEWGRLNGRVTVNIANGIPQLYHGGDRADIIWTAEDMAAFAAVAPQHVNDGLRLAALTGLRRADLVALTWAEIGDLAMIRTALKMSKRKRRKATVPLTPDLENLLAELRTRYRKPGVETVLVNSFGEPWTGDGFGNSVIRSTITAGIVAEDGRRKHLHDVRGTYATHLILIGLTDEEAAGVLAWSPTRVAHIRYVYVDQARVIVALGERLKAGAVNRVVNQQGTADAK